MDLKELKNKKDRTFKSRIKKLYKNSSNGDIEVCVAYDNKKKTYRAHSIVLAMASPVFERMFENENFETSIITIHDSTFETMEYFLMYVYQEEPALPSEYEAWSLYYLGEKYMMWDLKEFCLAYIKNPKVDKICSNYEMAKFFGLTNEDEYYKNCLLNNLREIFKTKDSMNLSPESLLMILNETELDVKESFLFLAVSHWVKNYMKSGDDEEGFEELDENRKELNLFDLTILKAQPRTKLVCDILSKIFFHEMPARRLLRVHQMSLLTEGEALSIMSNLDTNWAREVGERVPWPKGVRWCKRNQQHRNNQSESFHLSLPWKHYAYYDTETQSCKFSVNEPIYLNGLDIACIQTPPRGAHQWSTNVTPFYVEGIQIVVSDEASVQVYSAFINGVRAAFGESLLVMFDRHVELESDIVYRIDISFTQTGARHCMEPAHGVYTKGTTRFTFVSPGEESHFPVKSFRFCRRYDYFF